MLRAEIQLVDGFLLLLLRGITFFKLLRQFYLLVFIFQIIFILKGRIRMATLKEKVGLSFFLFFLVL